jgi:Na+-transporting NADH:ubiquinone oxidoreductase subunit A
MYICGIIFEEQMLNLKSGTILKRVSILSGIVVLCWQMSAAQSGGSNELPTLLLSLMGIVALLIVVLVVLVGNSMLRVRAKELGVSDKANYSVFPEMSEVTGNHKPAHIDAEVIKLRKGFDIKLKGQPFPDIRSANIKHFAIQPPNFMGMSPIPKVEPEIGDHVKAGDVLFYDKRNPEIKFVSPVSGKFIELRRGAKRAITHLVIESDQDISYRSLSVPQINTASREDLVTFLCENGFWPLIKQRPFNILASTTQIPRDIYISTFDTAPLAPDNDLIVNSDPDSFQLGLDLLSKLTSGKVHLGLYANKSKTPSSAFANAVGVEKHWFSGIHPAGCVGIQIHNINPILPGDTVWTLGVQEVMQLGRLLRDKRYDATRVIALSGAEFKENFYVSTKLGANVDALVSENLLNPAARLVSGDVLTGECKSGEDFLNAYDDQLTSLEEGRTHELFGWLLPLKGRPSISRTFPNFLMPNLRFKAETNSHGEERAFVVTGLYERVTPMDIYPQHLLKASIIGDIEQMEGLGIYEVVEEDLALCEFVCPSKVPVQKILRDGLTMIQEQG